MISGQPSSLVEDNYIFPFFTSLYDNSKNLHYFGNSFLINLIKKIDEEVYKLYFHELTKKEIKTYLTS